MKPIFIFFGVDKKIQHLLFCILFTVLSFNSKGQTTATEDFENETAANSGVVFSESGINFTTTFPLKSYPGAFPAGSFGYGASLNFLEIARVGSIAITTATISINTSTNPGVGFKINSFAAYTAANNGGTMPINGIVTFTGTPLGGGPQVTVDVPVQSASGTPPAGQTRETNGMVNGLTLGNTFNNLYFTTLTISINDNDLGSSTVGTSYLGLDHISFTSQAPVTNNYAIGNVSYVEGNSGSAVYAYNVTRSIATNAGSVQIASSNGTATTANNDYNPVSQTVNFTAGGPLTQTVNVTINGDATIEPNETFTMTLSNPVGGSIATGTGTITITDDDEFVEIFDDDVHNATTFSQNGITFSSAFFPGDKLVVKNGGAFGAGGSSGYSAPFENATNPYTTGNQGSFKITSPGKSFYMSKIDLWSATVSGGPTPNWTYTPTNCTVTFIGTKFDGSGTVTHTAAITPSQTSNPPRDVYTTVNFAGTPFANVNLSSISFSVPSPITYLQIDNFKYGVSGTTATQVSIDDVSVLEGTGGGALNTATFTITRTNNSSAFSVDVTSSNGTATSGADYTAYTTTPINFTNGGALSQTVTVSILKDASIEANETFNMNLSNATNGTLYLKQVGIGTILDDDKICETFDTDVQNATTFTENGITFSSTNRLKVTNSGNPNGNGSNASPGFLISGVGSAGSLGKMILTSPNKAFKLTSIDAWVGSNTSGQVTFNGTLFGGGIVSATKTVTNPVTPTTGPNANRPVWQQNITFTGTALDNVLLTELEVVVASPLTICDIDNFCYAIFNTTPIIELADAGNIPIINGGAASLSNNTDFGTACVTGGTVSKTFTIKNTGAISLTLSGSPLAVLGGANSNQFSILPQPSSSIAVGASVNFTVIFNPTSSGVKNATITLTSNDTSNSPFVINIKGEGIADPTFMVTTNNALSFDGTNDYVQVLKCGNNPIFPGGSAITIEYWFKGSTPHSVVRMQPSGNQYIVAGWNGKHIISSDGGTNGISMGASANNGSWHHVAMTWVQNTTNGFKSYLDGRLVEQRTSNNTPLPVFNSEVYLGALNGSSEFTNGVVDDVRIWNVARTQAEIQAGMCSFTTMQPGLIIYYDFNQGIANNNSNAGINTVQNLVNNTEFNGRLINFGLTGASSNWVTGLDKPAYANTLPTGAVVVTQNVSNNTFIDANCNIFAKVEPKAPNPVSGNIDVKQWNETSGTFPYVRRHYEINPAAGAANATADITLYFSQADFDTYNSTNATKLPQSPTDMTGIGNIKLIKYAGTSAPNNNGLPNSYSTSGVDKTGDITSKIWNGQFWEIKFSTTGFSGFFINTSSTPLPVNLISFSGKKTGENENTLTWKTSSEKNFSHFEIEKSENGKVFEKIGKVFAVENQPNNFNSYQFIDSQPSTPPSGRFDASTGGLFYRLKMVDLDGSSSLSKIISIENDFEKSSVGEFYPNPSNGNEVSVNITSKDVTSWSITSFDLAGRILKTENRLLNKGENQVKIKFEKGNNLQIFRFENGNEVQYRKVIKQ